MDGRGRSERNSDKEERQEGPGHRPPSEMLISTRGPSFELEAATGSREDDINLVEDRRGGIVLLLSATVMLE